MSTPLWISERDIRLSLGDTIALLRKGMQRQASGVAINMDKTHAHWTGGNMHAIGAVFADKGLLGVKSWAHTPKGSTPLEILWDAETGKLLAIIEAFAMGQLRTAGMAGLATDQLAQEKADTLALCGTGKQALAQAAAIRAVRPISHMKIFGRDPAKRAAFASKIAGQLGVKTSEHERVDDAVKNAPIVTLITRAKEPFLAADVPARGAHINAMGAITPERKEFAPELLERCAVVAVDSIDQARALASELIEAWGEDFSHPALISMDALIAKNTRRPAGADLTLFKSLGVGIADLSLAEEIYRLARERGVGRELPVPAPVPLDFSHP
jgi:ornithine cyclodeaminase